MVTIKEIAKRAGLHPTTVSGILNGTVGNSRASADSTEKVRRLAAKLGYIPNRAARQLRQGKTHSIGLVAGDIRNPFFAELAVQLETLLHENRYELLISCRGSLTASSAPSADPLMDFLQKSVDGLLVWAEQYRSDPPPRPAKKCPVVYLGAGPNSADRIEIDIAGGIGLALDHLAATGISHPVFFAPESADSLGLPIPRARLFRKLAAARPFRAATCHLVPHPSWDLASAVAAASDALHTKNFPGDGILAFNDVYAHAWLMAARKTRHSLPVVSFDGTPWLATWHPPVAHVKLPIRELSTAAVELLLRRIAHPSADPGRKTIRPEFVAARNPPAKDE